MVRRALTTCFLFFTVYGAIIPDQGKPIKRTPRCDVCNDHHSLTNFPPPPFFHTHQWSGLARNSDGSQQGVFSGATAAAANGGSQANNEAFSLASSSVNSNGGSNHGYNNNGQNFHNSEKANGFEEAADLHQIKSSRYGSASLSQSQSEIGKSWDDSKFGGYHVGGDRNSERAHERGDLNGAHNDDRVHAKNSYGSGPFDAAKQQNYHSSFGVNTGQAYNSGYNKGDHNNGFQSSQKHSDSGFGGNSQEVQKANFDSGRWNSHKDRHNAYNGQIDASQSSFGVVTGGTRDEGQATLQGALDLTSQSLQSAQQIQQAQPGCSTCGKGNYALSNSKSKNGNAVAVSIGG